jgi:hypothetical protein
MKIARPTALAAALLAALATASTAGAGLPGGATYTGRTAQGGAVKLELTGDGKRVKRMRIHYRLRCDNGRSGRTYTDILDARVGRNGRFSGVGTYEGAEDGSTNDFKVAGRLSRRSARGTFSLKAVGRPREGASRVRCKTGRLRWNASRRR